MEAYEQCQHQSELLHLLAHGENEIKAGRGHDLDTVIAEAEGLLEAMQR